MNKLFLFLLVRLLVVLSVLPVWGWQYPVKNLRVTSLFGESRYDHFHNGIDFANQQLIYPIEEGELLFYQEEDPLTGFIGVGNHMVIEHLDGIRSFYYHLANDSLDVENVTVSKNNAIATMGNTGKSYGNHLHLTIIDSQNHRVLNPQLLLPVLEDKKNPIIESLFFTIKQKPNIFKIKNRSVINYKNSIKLYLIAGDLKPYYPFTKNLTLLNARGLRKIVFSIDGQVHKKYEFDYLVQEGNKLVLNDGYDFRMTYGLSFNYLLGDFFPIKKKHQYHIEVEDWNGNRAVKIYNVIFRL